jgi:hypothetical protein
MNQKEADDSTPLLVGDVTECLIKIDLNRPYFSLSTGREYSRFFHAFVFAIQQRYNTDDARSECCTSGLRSSTGWEFPPHRMVSSS